MSEVTRILSAIEQGDPQAAGATPAAGLRRAAPAGRRSSWPRRQPGQTLQATALVHEAYLRLVGRASRPSDWDSRGHFFAAAAEAMRRILVERARRKRRPQARRRTRRAARPRRHRPRPGAPRRRPARPRRGPRPARRRGPAQGRAGQAPLLRRPDPRPRPPPPSGISRAHRRPPLGLRPRLAVRRPEPGDAPETPGP